MEIVESLFCDLFQKLRLWIPGRSETHTLSRDFWMPDHSCRVCYECDSPFSLFNRRHHCRVCGRIFCGRCTENTLRVVEGHVVFDEDGERVRVCNFCYRMKQDEKTKENYNRVVAKPPTPPLTPSSSSFSLSSNSTNTSRTSTSSSSSSGNTVKAQSAYGFRASRLDRIDPIEETSQRRISHPPRRGRRSQRTESPKGRDLSPNPYDFCSNRSEDDETDDQKEGTCPRLRMFDIQSPEEEEDDSCLEMDIGGTVNDTYSDVKFMLKPNDIEDENLDEDASLQIHIPTVQKSLSKRSMLSSDEYDGPEESVDESKIYAPSIVPPGNTSDSFDLENNPCVWDPPPREDEDDDLTLSLLDDDDDEEESGWVSSSNSDYKIREKPNASHEQKRAMRTVVEGHFRALVVQLLDAEGLEPETWLEIVADVASQAASIIKPDMSKDGGMDPGGYVKVKCIASGLRTESYVVKGVVCKRNVAHRRMVSRYKNPRLLLLGGSLEYQRVPNQLSSLDTLLQQEKEHLSMTVSRIEAHQPNVVLVEKTISRQAQERLLAKDITFILNVKKPLLERISRCTGAEIVPAPDHLMRAKLGHCDYFHVEKFDEDISSTGQIGKKSTKTLMFFEGCPRPLGCTVLLKGADLIELQKAKRVTQYAVFAAYQLALETSFLVDEGATVAELSLKSPISLTLPEKASFSERSITTVPGFVYPGSSQNNQGIAQLTSNHDGSFFSEFPYSSNMVWNNGQRRSSMTPASTAWSVTSSCFSSRNNSPNTSPRCSHIPETSNRCFSGKHGDMHTMSVRAEIPTSAPSNPNASGVANGIKCSSVYNSGFDFKNPEETAVKVSTASKTPMVAQHTDFKDPQESHTITEVMASKDGENGFIPDTHDANPEEFPPSPSDHQSILVSFTSSNLQKRAVCEKGRLQRIKYYGSFDKPLGKFLRDDVFDASKTCKYCQESREMHLHCYMHQQGSLTISVRRNSNGILSGEREGRIWMWHRCLKCMHVNNIPPATHRVHMSDAAWGLSFGKFLELSFSNHAAASRVASCGHSLHRDCLRFYGLGSMVACFRYAPIRVHSVYLPPSKLEFNNRELDGWLLNEIDEVTKNGTLFFAKAFNILREIEEQIAIHGSGKAVEARRRMADYETLLKNEQKCFLAMLKRASTMRKESDRVFADILQLNATKRSLATLYYVWISRFLSLNATLEMKKTIFRSSTVGDTSMLLSTSNVDFIDQYRMCPPDNEPDNILANDVSEQVKCIEFQDPEIPGQKTESFAKQDLGDDSAAVLLNSDANTNPDDLPIVNHIQQLDDDRLPTALVLHDKAIGVNSCNLDGEPVTNEDKKLPFSEVDEYMREKSVLCYSILENDLQVRRTLSEGQFPIISSDLSYTFEAAWTGKKHTVEAHAVNISSTGQEISSHNSTESFDEASAQQDEIITKSVSPDNGISRIDHSGNTQFSILYRQHIPNLSSLYASFLDLEHQGRLSLPLGISDTVVIVYDDEPTTVIAYAITSHQYYAHISEQSFEKDVPRQTDRENGKLKHTESLSTESVLNHPLQSTEQVNEPTETTIKDKNHLDEHIHTGTKEGGNPQYSRSTHVKVSFTDADPQGKIIFTVTCYYAKEFDTLRKTCCSDPMDFIRSLCHCKRWGAQGGKSNVFFAKTQDDRFVIKQVTKTELESFIKFAPQYFSHLSDSVKSGSPTCLAKILGVYQVTIKHSKGGKDIKMDLMAMENLLYGRHVNRLYDLKGSLRSRYNADKTGENKVLLDENLLESMATHPIFIGNKAKRILERAIWNDTSFLAAVDVMDYSLLVGVDEERQELVLGIIDFMRQYTWDKHLETWVKASGILGGPKNAQPTVISPKQYKKRFRKAMQSYFLMVPDQWSPTATIYGPPHVDSVESFHSTT